MTSEQLLEAIGEIEEALVYEVKCPPRKNIRFAVKWSSAAACFILLLIIIFIPTDTPTDFDPGPVPTSSAESTVSPLPSVTPQENTPASTAVGTPKPEATGTPLATAHKTMKPTAKNSSNDKINDILPESASKASFSKTRMTAAIVCFILLCSIVFIPAKRKK